mgnify:FL=1
MTHSAGMKFKGASKVILVPNSKAIYGRDKVYMGYSGNAHRWSEVIQWFYYPENKKPRIRDVEFLMLNDKKEIWHSVDFTNWLQVKEDYFSIGSGSLYALGALATGTTPKEAVKVASKLDPYTGMGIKEFNI